MESLPFQISPRVISHLGEDLIKNESIALLELVKNSYDACASICTIDFVANANNLLEQLIITDNGSGMDIETIRNVWMVIGTSNKLKPVTRPNACGRHPLGEKGVGRLGVHKLGHTITVTTRAAGKREVEINVDWRKLDNATEFDAFTTEIGEREEPLAFKDNQTGTKIVIADLKGVWDKRKIREVYRSLISLNCPFAGGSDGFEVRVNGDAGLFEKLPTFEDIKGSGLYFGRCTLSGTKLTAFDYHFKPWRSLTKVAEDRVKTISELIEGDTTLQWAKRPDDYSADKGDSIDLGQFEIGEIEIELAIFEKDTQIFSLIEVEKTSVKTYLRDNGGIRVYRDNVRVYDYGERNNDWLGIDLNRVGRVGGNISNNIVIGAVRINRAQSSGLKEKTNREGFIENDAYRSFREAVNYAVSLFVRERNIDKARLTTLYSKHKVSEPVLSDLTETIALVEQNVSVDAGKIEILNSLRRIQEQYSEVKGILIKSANAGLNLGVVIHELEKTVSALMSAVKNDDKIKLLSLCDRLEKIIRSHSTLLRKTAFERQSIKKVVETACVSYDFRFSDHKIELLYDCSLIMDSVLISLGEAVSMLINLLDNAIFWVCYARKENRKIAISITDQIEGFISIVVSDNGPGFNIPVDAAVKPFITGKPHNIGMGLGLHIVSELMNAMKGQVQFLDSDEIALPEKALVNGVTKAIVALCFKKDL